MDSVLILLAEAVKTAINVAVVAEEFETLGFTAVRSYPDWDDDFKDLNSLSVDVVPVSAGEAIELDSYESTDGNPAVDIAVRKRFEPDDRQRPGAATGRLKTSAVDSLIRLVEELHEKFESERQTPLTLAAGISANWIESEIKTHCDYKRLRESNFLGLIRLKYHVSKVV